MTPLLIVKTKNGFVVMEFPGDIPTTALDSLMVAANLRGSYSYGKDGLLGIVEEHFTETPKAAAE